MKKCICIVFLSLICRVYAQTENVAICTTPTNEWGACIPIRTCTSLLNLILKGNELTTADRQFLRQSQCDYRDNQPFVCCPDVNSTTVGDILPRPGKCGNNVVYRIYRGITTGFDAYPWMALLEYSKPNNTKGVHCMGVLISKRYVLTAAHCVNGNDIPSTWNLTGVRLGEYDLLKDPDCDDLGSSLECNPPVINVSISDIIIHNHYDPQSTNRSNDIALLRLQYDVEYSDFVHPICLPQSQKTRNSNYDNATLEVVGWNRITSEYSVKLEGRVDIVESAQCNRVYNSLGAYIQDSQLCGNSKPSTYEPCLGFPGSPVMAVTTEVGRVYWHLAGIESFGACGQGNWPNVYTRITSYIDWIEANVHV